MTRERFEQIQREFRLATMRELSYGCGDATLLLWGETITALKEAQIERDAAIADINNLIDLNKRKDEVSRLRDQVNDLRKGHDRYETARRLSPAQWVDVWKLNISTGKPFDEIIDDLRPFVRSNDPLMGHIAANAAERGGV